MHLDDENPWPSLDAFTESASPFFKGRNAEIEEMHRRVQRRNLTVLFGVSGLGKTSLLHAGLFPRLRNDRFMPVRIRRATDPVFRARKVAWTSLDCIWPRRPMPPTRPTMTKE